MQFATDASPAKPPHKLIDRNAAKYDLEDPAIMGGLDPAVRAKVNEIIEVINREFPESDEPVSAPGRGFRP